MRHLGVVLAVIAWSACSGGETDDEVIPGGAEEPAVVEAAFEILHHGHNDNGNGNSGNGGIGDGASHNNGHSTISKAVRRSLGRAAARIASLQADTIGDNARNGFTDTDPDDGGWDFTLPAAATTHTPTRSPTNLFGATGLGAWAAVVTGSAGIRATQTALDAALGMQRDADVDSAPDFVFGALLSELADNPGFAELARLRYDAKRTAAGGAAALGALIRDQRHAQNHDGLIAYDLGWFTLGAAALDAVFPGAGYAADARTYAQIVVDDLHSATPRFDPTDDREDSYLTGLAWSLVATAWRHDNTLFRQLRDRLLSRQRRDGAWTIDGAHTDPDIQATAHAMQTLALTGDRSDRWRTATRRAARWFLRTQAASGGWVDTAGIELPLVDAEIVLGLMLSQTEEGKDDGLTPDGVGSRAASPATYAQPAL